MRCNHEFKNTKTRTALTTVVETWVCVCCGKTKTVRDNGVNKPNRNFKKAEE